MTETHLQPLCCWWSNKKHLQEQRFNISFTWSVWFLSNHVLIGIPSWINIPVTVQGRACPHSHVSHLSLSLFICFLTSHTMFPLSLSLSLSPYLISTTSWSQLAQSIVLQNDIERKLYLILVVWRGAVCQAELMFYTTFLIWLISFSAACDTVHIHIKSAQTERGVMWKCKGNQSNEKLRRWVSRGVFYTVQEAFISVPDPYRNLSDAETRVLISSNLYANADHPDIQQRDLINTCLPCTQETSWEILHFHALLGSCALTAGIESLYRNQKPPIKTQPLQDPFSPH